MEGTAGFEGADFLEVFTFEVEVDFGGCWLLAFPWCSSELGLSSGSGGKVVQVGVGEDWCFVYIRGDELGCLHDGRSRERERVWVSHFLGVAWCCGGRVAMAG